MKSTLTECCIGGSRCLYKRLSGRPYVAVAIFNEIIAVYLPT